MLKKFLIAIALCVFVTPAFAWDPVGEETCVEWAAAGYDFDRCIDTSALCDYDWQCDSGYCNVEASYCSCSGCQQSAEICDANTYWDSSQGSCVNCPSWHGISGVGPSGSLSVSNCYIPSGSYYTGSDAAGSYRITVTSDCQHP